MAEFGNADLGNSRSCDACKNTALSRRAVVPTWARRTSTVVIAGKVMKRNGAMLGISYDRLAKLGDEARDRVYAAAGVENTRV